MKLQSFGVRNFRGIGPADGQVFPASDPAITPIDMSADRIFVVGPNNVGKSSLLWAYDYFVSAKRIATPEDFFGKDPANQIIIQAELRATAAELEDDQTKKWFSNNVAIVRKVWSKVGEEATKYTYDPHAHAWVEGGFGGLDTILQNRSPEPIWIHGFTTPEEIVTQLQALIREAVLDNLAGTDEFKSAQDALDALKKIIEDDKYVSELSNKISASIKDFYPDANLTISNPSSEKGLGSLFDKQAVISVSAQNSPSLPFGRHGHGLQRQLVISALQGAAAEIALLRLTKAQRKKVGADEARPRILLIEEPELFLSPPAVRVMKRLLKKLSLLEGFQIMAATHSPVMVDLAAEKQTIVRMQRGDGKALYHQIGTEFLDLDQRKTMRARTLFNSYFSECIFCEAAFVVEGEGELAAIPTLAERFHEEKSCPILLSWHTVRLAGKSDIQIVLRILHHLRVPYVAIHDLDDPGKETAWSDNFAIGTEVEKAAKDGLSASRVVFVRDFESAHGYECARKDKLTKALEYAQTLDLDGDPTKSPLLNLLQSVRNGMPHDLHVANAQLDDLNKSASANAEPMN